MRVGLLHPGEMGAAIGALLVERGHEVLWRPSGRSAATAGRAAAAGLTGADDVLDVDVVLSVCPPHAALDVARSVQGTRALVIDANAVSPMTARQVGEVIGERWVDGGIVGPPPDTGDHAPVHVRAARDRGVGAVAGTRLEPVVLDGSPVAASSLKMAYAAWTKGSAALLLAALDSARGNGVEDALRAEWSRSLPQLGARWQSAADSASSKGWRWVGEMNEIAATFESVGLPAGFHEAAAEMFERAARQSPGEQRAT